MQTLRKQWIAGGAGSLLVLATLSLFATPAEERKEFETALVHRDCAPWDGPAVSIEFYTSPAKCDQKRASTLRISLWRNLPPRAGQKIALGHDSKLGVAAFCPQENRCESAESGSVVIESYDEGKGASGRYDLVFSKAGHLTGSFRAAWCVSRLMRCG